MFLLTHIKQTFENKKSFWAVSPPSPDPVLHTTSDLELLHVTKGAKRGQPVSLVSTYFDPQWNGESLIIHQTNLVRSSEFFQRDFVRGKYFASY